MLFADPARTMYFTSATFYIIHFNKGRGYKNTVSSCVMINRLRTQNIYERFFLNRPLNVKEIMWTLKALQTWRSYVRYIWNLLYYRDFLEVLNPICQIKNWLLMNFYTFINFYVLMNYLADISVAIIQLKL